MVVTTLDQDTRIRSASMLDRYEGFKLSASIADSLELKCAPLGLRDLHREIIDLLEPVSSEILIQKPVLLYWYGLALFSESRLTAGQEALNLLNACLSEQPDNLNHGRLCILQALESIFMGDSHTAFNYAREATSLLPETAYQELFRAWATREVLARHLGTMKESEEAFQELTYLRQKLPWDQRWWFVFVVPNHADWLLKTGQMQGSEQLLQAQLNVSSPALDGIFLLRLARIALEQQDIPKAEQWLDRMETGNQNLIRPDSYWSVEISLLSAQILRQKGDLQAALDVLSEAIRTYHHLGSLAELRALHLMMAEIWLEQKQYDLAARWIDLYARHMEIWPRTFGQPVPRIIEADLLIAKDRSQEALEILEMLRKEGEERGLFGMLVQIHAKRAYAYAMLGEERSAIQAVRDAGGYDNYALSFFVQGVDTRRFLTQGISIISTQYTDSSKDPWALSDREREVLALVRDGLTNREIADYLYIARNTVKNHLANIYSRWGITSRQDAVRIAEARGLLDSSGLDDSIQNAPVVRS